MGLKKLDWYIIKKFLGTFFYAITLIILIVIIFDLSENIDKLIENKAPVTGILFVYYFNFIPYFINLFSPLFTFIAVIYFTSRLAFNTEIIAILSAGISFKRLMVPYFISAIFLAFLSIYLSNFLIPNANSKRIDFENTYIKTRKQFQERNIHLQIRPGEFVFLEHIQDGKLTYKLLADRAEWIDSTSTWSLRNFYVRQIDDVKEILESGSRLDTILQLKPADFIQNVQEMETMNFVELRAYIENEKLKGSENIRFFLVEKHRRIAFPFATLVLTLIGVALSSRKVRGGIGLHLGMGLMISFTFIMFMQVSTTFATNGNLPAIVAVWIPNIVFALLAFYLVKTAPK